LITYIHSATVKVADQNAALDFYVNTLGWQKAIDQAMGEEDRFITVVPTGSKTELALAPARWFGPDAKPGGQSGISMVCNDIDGTYKTLTERGVKFKEPPAVMPWGQKATFFYDVDDNEFFLVEE
jgi:catechol 2,3-dioxygenase-like lactoylglutathione lyase family enzyme